MYGLLRNFSWRRFFLSFFHFLLLIKLEVRTYLNDYSTKWKFIYGPKHDFRMVIGCRLFVSFLYAKVRKHSTFKGDDAWRYMMNLAQNFCSYMKHGERDRLARNWKSLCPIVIAIWRGGGDHPLCFKNVEQSVQLWIDVPWNSKNNFFTILIEIGNLN